MMHDPKVQPLPAPFNRPPPRDALEQLPETRRVVESQVAALLERTPSYHQLSRTERGQLRDRMVNIGTYAAELVRLDWNISDGLGQTPLVKTERRYRREPDAVSPPAAATLAAADDFKPAAASQIAEVTESTLRAIAFPTFVADLIDGSFNAIVASTIKQMQAFMEMVENVSKSVDEFMRDNVSENQGRDYLVQAYPDLFRIETSGDQPTVEARAGAEDKDLSGLQAGLALPDPVAALDPSEIEEVLVPAARRRLAQSRLQMLSSMVTLGLQRIVVKHGRIRATMGFHIDSSDRAHSETASSFDFSHQSSVTGFFYVAFSAKTSVAYVRSTKSDSDAELNVNADLTGEVDIFFETDYLPLNRLAKDDSIAKIVNNTPNPAKNTPVMGTASRDTGPSASQMVSDTVKKRDTSAPKIDKSLIDAAAGAGKSLMGMAGAG